MMRFSELPKHKQDVIKAKRAANPNNDALKNFGALDIFNAVFVVAMIVIIITLVVLA